MSSYQNFSPDSKFIPKKMLNNNRVLTMSNNRKCDYLIVDVCTTTGNNKDITTMMAINNQGNSKDILVVKTFIGKSFEELVDEAYWLCCEFGIKIVLGDKMGLGLGFIETFKDKINQNNIKIRELDGNKINQMANISDIINDLKNGNLRFLQAPELAKNTYIKPFLGLSNIMEYHKETSELINEINNLEVKMKLGNIYLDRLDDSKGKSRVNCLLMFYSYPMSGVCNNNISSNDNDYNEKYYIAKRNAQYENIYGIFYKYMFKCVENDNINVIFYHNGSYKIKQFQNMVQEEKAKELFQNHIERIINSKENFEIIFLNGSSIKFVYASDNARGYRYHFAVVDNQISREVFDSIVRVKGILFDVAKEKGKLKEDNYCVEFVDMWMD